VSGLVAVRPPEQPCELRLDLFDREWITRRARGGRGGRRRRRRCARLRGHRCGDRIRCRFLGRRGGRTGLGFRRTMRLAGILRADGARSLRLLHPSTFGCGRSLVFSRDYRCLSLRGGLGGFRGPGRHHETRRYRRRRTLRSGRSRRRGRRLRARRQNRTLRGSRFLASESWTGPVRRRRSRWNRARCRYSRRRRRASALARGRWSPDRRWRYTPRGWCRIGATGRGARSRLAQIIADRSPVGFGRAGLSLPACGPRRPPEGLLELTCHIGQNRGVGAADRSRRRRGARLVDCRARRPRAGRPALSRRPAGGAAHAVLREVGGPKYRLHGRTLRGRRHRLGNRRRRNGRAQPRLDTRRRSFISPVGGGTQRRH
jgi:hypothetical protein